ncbi:MAG: YicC/YloC family endoribonuclease [Filifactoraceae bacterium]
MTMSMTGYGRGESFGSKYNFVVEAKSVNNRYLEIFVKLPKNINYLEEYIRQTLKTYVSRGKVEIFVKLNMLGSSESKVMIDSNLVMNYKTLLSQLDESLEFSSSVRSIDILRLPDVLKLTEAELDEGEILSSLNQAMELCFESLKKMRVLEGEQLKSDITLRCVNLSKYIDLIEEKAELIEQEQRDRLVVKMTDLLGRFSVSVDEQRIVQEAAILADKSNVTEELVRFKSHIDQLIGTVKLDSEPIGRKLDFIIQEMNREVNTIGSKSINMEITDYVIELKSELEKIREQIQNLE